jgi:hypothetical protein
MRLLLSILVGGLALTASPAAAERWVAISSGVTEGGGTRESFVDLLDVDAVRKTGAAAQGLLVRHYSMEIADADAVIDRHVLETEIDCAARTAAVKAVHGHGYRQGEPRLFSNKLYDFSMMQGRQKSTRIAPTPQPVAIDGSSALYRLSCTGSTDYRPFWNSRSPQPSWGGWPASNSAWSSLAAARRDADVWRDRELEGANMATLANSEAPAAIVPSLPARQGYIDMGWGDAAWMDLASVRAEGKALVYTIVRFDKDAPPGEILTVSEEMVVCPLNARRMRGQKARTAAGDRLKPAPLWLMNWRPAEGMESAYLCRFQFSRGKVVKTLAEARAAYDAFERSRK